MNRVLWEAGIGEYECSRCGGSLGEDSGKCENWDCDNFGIPRDECLCPDCESQGCQSCNNTGYYADYLVMCEKQGIVPDEWVMG